MFLHRLHSPLPSWLLDFNAIREAALSANNGRTNEDAIGKFVAIVESPESLISTAAIPVQRALPNPCRRCPTRQAAPCPTTGHLLTASDRASVRRRIPVFAHPCPVTMAGRADLS